ncbi:MAG: peptidase M17 [Betaproteobacteria bacterium RIFCSPLOWO2_02_FULL_67_26]|nr:MAG: peptidase M17 [Betaproteobacteria bacterium RIFCSPLOWO2_02_FULL_67_26]
MLARLEQNATLLSESDLDRAKHALIVLPKAASLETLRGVPGVAALSAALARRKKKLPDLAKAPLATDLARGALVSWVMLDPARSVFERQTVLRKGLQLLLSERPEEIVIGVFGPAARRRHAAELAAYAAWVNGARLPERKRKPAGPALQSVRVFGHRARDAYAWQRAVAEGNLLCRELTVLPPNELTPGIYRRRVREIARQHGWRHEEYDVKRLRKMGAGAFIAVAQGSAEEDAAIVRLGYRHPRAGKSVALVGKGICFDTGGHNLKPARYMHGMHKDMNGSAVALGIFLAAAEMKLPVRLDCWMAIARNDISPRAYHQNEVVTALNGTTIEIVHTDAEGRMVLADTLALAARAKPDLMVDFATLTGSMHVAVGERYSGVFATRESLLRRAIAAGTATGERVCGFPMDEDYDEALESDIADVKQCTLDGEADHILATRFLRRFTGDTPWLHMDLASAKCKGGLGAVATDITGFGVAWGVEYLRAMLG